MYRPLKAWDDYPPPFSPEKWPPYHACWQRPENKPSTNPVTAPVLYRQAEACLIYPESTWCCQTSEPRRLPRPSPKHLIGQPCLPCSPLDIATSHPSFRWTLRMLVHVNRFHARRVPCEAVHCFELLMSSLLGLGGVTMNEAREPWPDIAEKSRKAQLAPWPPWRIAYTQLRPVITAVECLEYAVRCSRVDHSTVTPRYRWSARCSRPVVVCLRPNISRRPYSHF